MINQNLFAELSIALILSICSIEIFCQELDVYPENRVGVNYFTSDQTWLDVNYLYETTSVNFTYHNLIHQGLSSEVFWTLETAYGVSKYYENDLNGQLLSGYEAGLGVGIRMDKNMLSRGLVMFAHIHTGPNYISDAPDRQVPGLLFSSGLDLGLNVHIYSNLSISMFWGFRHMSNGEFRLPNGGINKIVKGLGINLKI